MKDDIYFSGTTTPKDSNINSYLRNNTLINTEKKIEQRKNEMNGLNAVNNKKINNSKNDIKKFQELIICNENNILYINNDNKYNNKDMFINYNDRKNEFEKELKNMMINIQKRKNILLNLKKQMNEKMTKLEFRKK